MSTFLRFCASGAVCASGVHLIMTPLDVIKTKIQTVSSLSFDWIVSKGRTFHSSHLSLCFDDFLSIRILTIIQAPSLPLTNL
jgi:hypothetical protein